MESAERVMDMNNINKYKDNANVFPTVVTSAYRIVGVDQIEEMINNGYIRPRDYSSKTGDTADRYRRLYPKTAPYPGQGFPGNSGGGAGGRLAAPCGGLQQ